ncbi:MAG: hypothetical protein M0C28_02100 [Candidatus Moduliflexus flocculans]|nr:hypothetical protein [Candidatus Moduliflexus flocculans]
MPLRGRGEHGNRIAAKKGAGGVSVAKRAPVHRARRHRRLLRRRRGPARPVAQGQAGHRRRPAPRARRGLDLLLRGPQVRRPLRHAAARVLSALPRGRLRPRQLPGLPGLLGALLPASCTPRPPTSRRPRSTRPTSSSPAAAASIRRSRRRPASSSGRSSARSG